MSKKNKKRNEARKLAIKIAKEISKDIATKVPNPYLTNKTNKCHPCESRELKQ